MTISSSLNAGVSGLNVNASKLATISDNIANSGTFGYKRAEANFSALVRTSSRGTYTAGGTMVSTFRQVEAKGALIATSNATDLSVSGRGLLPVTDIASLDSVGELPLMLTATGSFEPDASGVLRTQSGLVMLGWPAAADGSIPPQPRDTVAGLEPVIVNPNQLGAEPTTKIELGLNLPAAETRAGSTGDTLTTSLEYFGNLGTSDSLVASFTPQVPTSGYSNTWILELSDSATADASNPVARFELGFDDSRSGGGTLTRVDVLDGGIRGESFDAETGLLKILVGGDPLAIEIGVPNTATKLTQLSSGFAPISITKDGAPVGNLSTIDVDENGLLKAVYDTGFTRLLYQIPVANVPNFNGLTALNDQAFGISISSGSLYLWDAGDGPAGSVVAYSREESTTDLAAELTQLIQTQRAYSSNAKIIQTVDEMLQETTNIKR